jgi:hypothetical protein
MLTISNLEGGLEDLVEGYKISKDAVNNNKSINFKDKSIGFELGTSFYVLFNFNKVRNYRKIKDKIYK